MERKNYDDPVKYPIVQEIILSNQIGSIAMLLAERLHVSPETALKLFYQSRTCADLHDRSTRLYLFSDRYIVDEYCLEKSRGLR